MLGASQQSLLEVFIAHRAQLRSIAQRIVDNAEIAEDVTQDAYMRIVEGRCADEVEKPFSYCCQIVRNIALDHYRRQGVEAAWRVFSPDGELPDVPGGVAPERVVEERRVLVAVEQALGTLPQRTRHAFELFRLGGLTQREIGRRLDCSATLVNFMVKDAMNALSSCRMLMDA